MKNTRPGIPRLFIVLSLALIGLTVLQVMLLRYAWDWKQQSFERAAQSALAATVVTLESREIEGTAYDYFFSLEDSLAGNGNSFQVAVPTPMPAPPRPGRSHFRHRPGRLGMRRVEEYVTSSGHADSLVIVVQDEATSHSGTVHSLRDRSVALRKVVGEWINQPPAPIADRLDRDDVSRVLGEELAKVGISAMPHFGVLSEHESKAFYPNVPGGAQTLMVADDIDDTEVVLASDHVTEAELLASPYRHRLFPLDPFSSRSDLVLVFPRDRLYLFWQIWPLWLASILFMGAIVYSFARTWRTNSEQRRFADQLVDFINNMTHEFKTPISTVGLAGEAIARDDVRREPELFERYLGMIRDENQRMHRQVDKILQMARLERGDLELNRELVDVHEVLGDVAASFSLTVEKRGGTLACDLGAARSRTVGDPMHLENIFRNLVDNAVKYSPRAPLIRIATSLDKGYLTIRVSDQGLGIDRESQKRVFDKYYRCSTGNRHDVKGYGLGLSFVKRLVTAHGGFVELHSIKGRGTTVTVSLPLAGPETEVTP